MLTNIMLIILALIFLWLVADKFFVKSVSWFIFFVIILLFVCGAFLIVKQLVLMFGFNVLLFPFEFLVLIVVTDLWEYAYGGDNEESEGE